MNLLDLINRKIPPDPWAEGEKIPWHDSDFSSRMLREHLTQDHNAASRRTEIIEQHVNWLHTEILANRAAKILDLGCGPGLYTSRLAKLGHTCIGIDYGPASIAYARQQAEDDDLDCRYIEADVREASFGTDYDLVMMINGELNVFRPAEIRAILEKARQALLSGGYLVLEVHTLVAVRALGERETRWSTTEKGLFSEHPHLLLQEGYWDAERRVTTERYYIIDAKSSAVTRHAASMQGYDNEGYRELLESCRFGEIEIHPLLGEQKGVKDENYVVFVAQVSQV